MHIMRVTLRKGHGGLCIAHRRKKVKGEGDKDEIEFIDLGFETGQVVRSGKGRRQDVP